MKTTSISLYLDLGHWRRLVARLAKACISVLKRKADGYSLNMALLGLCEYCAHRGWEIGEKAWWTWSRMRSPGQWQGQEVCQKFASRPLVFQVLVQTSIVYSAACRDFQHSYW